MDKKVCVIYTGGTIGMVPTENGYAPEPGYFEGLLNEIPQLRYPDMPYWKFVEFDPLLDSSDMSVEHWNMIGRAIAERYDDFDGFVVLHGTDTMAYSASALSFMLEGLAKPVIFTGSQIPMCQVGSDGLSNLVNSLLIAAEGVACEVGVFFNGELYRGNRSVKVSADSLDAFKSPNARPLATVGMDIRYHRKALSLPVQSDEFRLCEFGSVPIAVLKLFPGINFDRFQSLVSGSMKAVILEAFGSGNIPSSGGAFDEFLKKADDSGTVIAVCSQCSQGTARLGAYAASSSLKNFGALSCLDMTTEAAVAKFYYLFSKGLDRQALVRAMETNLRGEVSI
ncbi:MAG: type I asparaginase [Firmicutes bacterium]|nr:type I asparaginase [Bacillota bacterium]